MKGNKPINYEKSEIEIKHSLNTLKRHGININLLENIVARLDAKTLFDGDDGPFKELKNL